MDYLSETWRLKSIAHAHGEQASRWRQSGWDRKGWAGWPPVPVGVRNLVGVSLQVTDIFATFAIIVDRGVEFVAPPEQQPWGGVLAHLRDPDGNVLTLPGDAREPGAASDE